MSRLHAARGLTVGGRASAVRKCVRLAATPGWGSPALGQAVCNRPFYRREMNPRAVVVVLMTMITAVTGFTVVNNIAELPLDASTTSTTSTVSEPGR